jgi:protease I
MQLSDARVLIVATDGFEEWELFGPRKILQERGSEVVLASLKRDPIQATIHDDPGKTIRPDLTIDEANADDLLRDRIATSWPSIRTDLRNAGAKVIDEAAVTDGNIVTSRNPDDVEAFTNALIDLIESAPEVQEIREPSELPA